MYMYTPLVVELFNVAMEIDNFHRQIIIFISYWELGVFSSSLPPRLALMPEVRSGNLVVRYCGTVFADAADFHRKSMGFWKREIPSAFFGLSHGKIIEVDRAVSSHVTDSLMVSSSLSALESTIRKFGGCSSQDTDSLRALFLQNTAVDSLKVLSFFGILSLVSDFLEISILLTNEIPIKHSVVSRS